MISSNGMFAVGKTIRMPMYDKKPAAPDTIDLRRFKSFNAIKREKWNC